jgi:Malectin domain
MEPTTMNTPIFRPNCGGQAYNAPWLVDQYLTGDSSVYTTTKPILNTNDPILYQSERYGKSFGYKVPVANGIYIVNLYFAEIYYSNVGQRLFNVSIQGALMLSSFDIIAAAKGANRAVVKSFVATVSNGSLTIDFKSVVNNAKISALEVILSSVTSPPVVLPPVVVPPTVSNVITQAQYEAAIQFDKSGENGILQSNPTGKAVGYPCGVPNSYSWKFGTKYESNLQTAVQGRGLQTAGAAYIQVYNTCLGTTGRKSMPNCRVEFSNIVVQYYSISQVKWLIALNQPLKGASFAEDFVNNESTGGDYRTEGNNYASVRSGIGNAAGDAGSSTGRAVEDGSVGFNFHGFPPRFSINWVDAQAIVISQAMRLIPHSGTDLTDCEKLGYLANVGIDSWHTTVSSYDNFKTHGGVSGGRFKPVTLTWQVFTNSAGDFTGIGYPAAPPL